MRSGDFSRLHLTTTLSLAPAGGARKVVTTFLLRYRLGTSALYRLIEIHNRTRHHAGLFRGNKCNSAGYFFWFEKTAKRHACLRIFEPVVTSIVIFVLDDILTGCIHPADVEHIDPNAVAHNSIGNILCEGHQRAFGSSIGREKRDTAIS